MRRIRAFAFASAILAAAGTARPDIALPNLLNVLGSVTNAARPVANALVIALNLNNLEASQTFTASDGSFILPLLPGGVYKVIAIKYGFAPASAMVVPSKKDQRVALRLQTEKRGKDANQEIWEIRGSLPPDVLHQLEIAMAPPVDAAVTTPEATPRIRGQMMSMTGVAVGPSDPAFAQTALGVQSRITGDWQLGFRGNLHRIENPTDDARFGTPMAEASGMQMELRSSSTDAVRVASTKSWWRYRADVPEAQQQADVRSHNFEWEHGDARLQVRYFEQQNIFNASPGSDLIEVAGNTTVLQTPRSGVGVSLRVTQENLHNRANATFRTADLTTTANLEVVPAFTVRYGMTSRLGLYGAEWAPRTGAEWKLSRDTSFIVSAMYKVYDQQRQNMMPSVVVWSDESSVIPRYAYSFGFVSGEGRDRLSAIATVSAADSPLRVIFTDGFEQFWDGLYVDTGDIRRDLRLSYRKELGKHIVIDMSSSAGVATPPPTVVARGEKVYVTGDVASTFQPTGTTVAVSYRQLHQPQPNASGSQYHTDRMNVRVAQSLHLPFDLRVLLGMEVARAANSPFLFDSFDSDGTSRKYIGGLAVNF